MSFLELIGAHLCMLIIKIKISYTTVTTEAKYPINFTQTNKSLHNNGKNSFLFANARKIYQFKAKMSEINDYALCLGNISKDFTINNMKKELQIFFSIF